MDEVTTTKEDEALTEERFLISDLCDLIAEYMDQEQVKEVYRAYLFGAQYHEGQHRMSGEPYIYHPIAVAKIVANEIGLGAPSIAAALLHDVVEDTHAQVQSEDRQRGHDHEHGFSGSSARVAAIFITTTSKAVTAARNGSR